MRKRPPKRLPPEPFRLLVVALQSVYAEFERTPCGATPRVRVTPWWFSLDADLALNALRRQAARDLRGIGATEPKVREWIDALNRSPWGGSRPIRPAVTETLVAAACSIGSE